VHVESVSILLADGIQLPPLLAGVIIAYVLVLFPVPVIDVAFLPSQLALQSVQALQFPLQLIGQFVIVHVESVSILLADGIQLPPLLAGVVTAYVLVLLPVPVIDVAFLPSQLALQSVQALQFPLQLIGQFVIVHVESVSILLADGIQLPPLLAGVVTAYVLVLLPVPVIDVAFLPSQLALQSVQASQPPMQLIGQFVLVHVESVSIALFD
jgi:hydrogenase maturation factor